QLNYAFLNFATEEDMLAACFVAYKFEDRELFWCYEHEKTCHVAVTLTTLLRTALARIPPTVKNQNSRNSMKSFTQPNIAITPRLRIKNHQMVKVFLMLTLPNLGKESPRSLPSLPKE